MALRRGKYSGIWELFIVSLILGFYSLPSFFILISGFFGEISIAKWQRFSFDSFVGVFSDSEMLSALYQSILIAMLSSLLGICLAFLFLAASRMLETREVGLISRFIYLPISFPDIVWALGCLILAKWGFMKTGFSMVLLVHITFNLALAYLIIRPSVTAIGQEKIEAARDLGSPWGYVLFFVVLPEVFPTLLAGIALCFIFSFDDFVLTFLLGGTEVQTVPLYLYGKLKYGASEEVIGLASLTTILGICGVILAWFITTSKNLEGA